MKENFAADWLTLREPVDHRSRPPEIVAQLNRLFPSSDRIQVLDLGAGTGSNYRYLAPRLSAPQNWLLYDHDATLLAKAAGATPLNTVVGDLQALIKPAGNSLLTKADFITASALLDLVSARWLSAIIQQITEQRRPALFALSYNGIIKSSLNHPTEAALAAAVNAHQRGNKGLGAALGPDASHYCAELFRASGYQVWQIDSPWQLGPTEADLQKSLIDGWLQAAGAAKPEQTPAFLQWQRDYLAQIDQQSLYVGHQDILALPV